MALKGLMKKGERPVEAPGPLLAGPPRSTAPTTSVDASTELKGRLRCKETLRIDGRIEGEVECEKTVLVGGGAKVHASITADEVQVVGLVKGDITARRKITLESTAVVTGDLSTPGIVIEEGAKVKGQITIGSDDEPAKDARPQARKQGAASDERAEEPSPRAAAAG